MNSLVNRFDWNRFRCKEAKSLPGVIEYIANSDRWHPGTLASPNQAWEVIARATYDEGEIPDVAYAVLPCLVTLARQQKRQCIEKCLVFGYVLDATLGGLPNREDIPFDLVEPFVDCIDDVRTLATECDPSAVPEGEKVRIVAARLLDRASLASAYLVHGSLVQDLVLRCVGCGTGLSTSFDGGTGTVEDGIGNIAPIVDGQDDHWERSVLERVREFEHLSDDLRQIRDIRGAFRCPQCRHDTTIAAGVAAALMAQCPISRVNGWVQIVRSWL